MKCKFAHGLLAQRFPLNGGMPSVCACIYPWAIFSVRDRAHIGDQIGGAFDANAYNYNVGLHRKRVPPSGWGVRLSLANF